MRILLIEDSRDIAAALKQVLTAAQYSVTHVVSGEAGLAAVQAKDFDIIILDLSLPDIPGAKLCEMVRDDGRAIPILVLTGDDSVISKIRALDAGADDYLTKPFSLGELKARLRVLQRRKQQLPVEASRLTVGGLTLDRHKYRVERDGQTISLRRKEFALLECLMRHAGTVVTRSALGNYAWQGADTPWTNTIDVHIKHLRDKIDRPFKHPLIRTVHGLGYKLENSHSPPARATLGSRMETLRKV
jgi:two-component system OmpR family response regulator